METSFRPQVEGLENRCVPAAGATTSFNEAYVSQLYRDLLHREADPAGLHFFATQMSLRGTAGMSPTQVALTIIHSQEYRTDVVEDFYQRLLGRAADQTGIAFWTSLQARGFTAEQVEEGVLSSDEYFTLHGSTNDGFLAGVYQDVLGRPPDPAGKATFDTILSGGISGRASVATAILSSLESDTREVEALYLQLLHRPADQQGLSVQANQLQSGVSNETLAVRFVTSTEYFADVQAQVITK